MGLGPVYSWGVGGWSCREKSQKCVFTFTTCFPKSSSRQLKFKRETATFPKEKPARPVSGAGRHWVDCRHFRHEQSSKMERESFHTWQPYCLCCVSYHTDGNEAVHCCWGEHVWTHWHEQWRVPPPEAVVEVKYVFLSEDKFCFSYIKEESTQTNVSINQAIINFSFCLVASAKSKGDLCHVPQPSPRGQHDNLSLVLSSHPSW